MSQSTIISGKTLLKELKSLAKAIKNCPPLRENHLFEREITGLIKSAENVYLTLFDDKSILGEKISALDVINDRTVSELTESLSQNGYIGESDIDSLVWQGKLCVIREALKEWRQKGSSFDPQKHYEKMYALRDLDMEELSKLSPVHRVFSEDSIYRLSSSETRAMFRSRTAQLAREIGIDEERYLGELTKRAETENRSVIEVLETDFRNVFPYRKTRVYLLALFLVTALVSAAVGLFSHLWLVPLVFLPVFGIVKPFADLLISRGAKSLPLPRAAFEEDMAESENKAELGKLWEKGKTLCAMSSLVSDEKSLEEALKRLKNAKLKNPQEGIYYALLLDLPPKDEEKDPSDKALFSAADRLREKIFPECVLFFRNRSYCKTMNKWQGWERKRGAIEQLAEFMCEPSVNIDRGFADPSFADTASADRVSARRASTGQAFADRVSARRASTGQAFANAFSGKPLYHKSFAYISGKREMAEAAKDCEFIAALDFDTIPLMDSIKELSAIALHPLNKKYGIIAPRCTSTLESTLKTPFARAMAGNGGVSGISSYDSFGGEFYFDCFGEGIFCGKGLIRKKEFLDACKDKLPNERVLSHDILEGGFAGVGYSGSTEFSDSFPASSKAYFKRAHRWIRGDLQNIRFIFKKEFSPLTKFKLFDNFRRGIAPLLIFALLFVSCFAEKGLWAAITAYCALLLPFLPPLAGSLKRGFGFGITRRFYSPIVSETAQLALRALMELMTLPKAALVSLDAGAKVLWRTLVSKKKLLEWTTSGVLEKTAFKGNAFSLLPAFLASLVLLACGALGVGVKASGAFLSFLGGIFMCAAFPFFLYADKPRKREKPVLPKKARAELLSQTEKMWHFFERYVGKDTHFLPPDNVQFFPVYRTAMRTSPTNIGMYLLAAAAVFNLGIIDRKEFGEIVENSVESVEKLEKWRGNLYNWYDLNSLAVISGFVSSVDSGNFLACLIAVKECLVINEISPSLAVRCEKIISETDLGAFYCKKKKLFSIGYDSEKGELSHHRYDMLMSEARILSYTAIALGQAPKSHWRALSRTMSRCGSYAGAIAWTGTMFEFYMPELLLTSKEGSMSYEALRYSFYCQKRRHRPFGISESGYYAFDRDLNYQYKAHGVQKTALKGGMDRECVISPYSSYLAMSLHPLESWNNLALLEREGAFDPEFGFYEAVDYTKGRVGDKAVIKSFMAHHTGMGICGAANALCSNICARLFLNDERMKRAEELLEEKVMAGEKVLKITEEHYDDGKVICEREETVNQQAENSPVNVLWSGQLALFTSANGCFYSTYKGMSGVVRTADFLDRPQGAFYGFCDEKNVYPFFAHPRLKNDLKTVFNTGETEYIIDTENFAFSMKVKALGECNAEIRSFSVKNKTKSKKQLMLCCYSEPVLAPSRDHSAHPMFMDLFLKIGYDRDSKLFKFYRKDRHSDHVTACAAGFLEDEDFTYCLSKEDCTDYLPFSFFKKAFLRQNEDKSVPDPCLFVRDSISLDAGEEKRCTLFYCYGDSVGEVQDHALRLRMTKASSTHAGIGEKTNDPDIGENKKAALRETGDRISQSVFEQDPLSPLSLNTLQGRMAERVLPALLYNEVMQEEILQARKNNILNRKDLWRFGISGDFPLLVTRGLEGLAYIALLKTGLIGCGINCDLAVLCSNALEKGEAESILGGNGYALLMPEKDSFTQRDYSEKRAAEREKQEDIITLIYSLAAYVDLQKLFSQAGRPIDKKSEDKMPLALPVIPCSHPDSENGFKEGSYVIGNEHNTWCNILANPEFGSLLSQNSLGFTFALNSRENKLTPWSNDIIKDNCGEMLLLKTKDAYYDLIRGSRAEFSPYSCLYEGTVLSVNAKTEVKVYSSGLGKEISLTLTNTTETECSFDLVYRIKPLMSADREGSMAVAYTLKNGAAFFNSQNDNFSGVMALYCSKKPQFCFSPLEIAAGDLSKSKGEGGVYNSPVTAVIIPVKLPPRENLRIRFILGYFNEEMALEKAIEEFKKIGGSGTGLLSSAEETGLLDQAAETGHLNSAAKTDPWNSAAKTELLNSARERAAALAIDYLKKTEGSPCGNEAANAFTISTPIQSLNELFNTWLPHQITACRLWGRTGFFQNGGAFGFRDQLQDCLAVMYVSPEAAREHIFRCCQSQFPEGDVLHWWHDLSGKRVGVRTRYSDDLLWLPYAACCYDEMFGEEGFWDRQAAYCKGELLPRDRQELFMTAECTEFTESLYDHCKAAMEKGFNKGTYGLIKIGCGDWNDGYNNVGVQGKGESVWLAMFYIICARKFAAIAKEKDDTEYAEKLEKRIAELCVSIEENAWDGDRYLRAFYDNGEKMGSKDSAACRIDILPQAFAVLCDLPDGDRSITALNSAYDRLVDKKAGIIKLFTPPFTEENTQKENGEIGLNEKLDPKAKKSKKSAEKNAKSPRPGYVMSYPEGVRENGGQYTHGAVWFCLACFKAGQKERAFKLLNMLNPALKTEDGGEYGESYKKEKEKAVENILSNISSRDRSIFSAEAESAFAAEIGAESAFASEKGIGDILSSKTADSLLQSETKENGRAAEILSSAATPRSAANTETTESALSPSPVYPDKNFGREPYFMTADIYTNPQCYGRGGWSMYTGAASWYWKCIFEGLFGGEMKKGKLIFKPNLPKELDGTEMKIKIGGKKMNLRFKYAEGQTKETAVDGEGDHDVFFGD